MKKEISDKGKGIIFRAGLVHLHHRMGGCGLDGLGTVGNNDEFLCMKGSILDIPQCHNLILVAAVVMIVFGICSDDDADS